MQACQPQSEGFALPPGDAERGKATFVELECNACHRIDDVVSRLDPGDPTIDVRLGGQVSRIKTYGDLVTSIINPSHKLSRGKNKMTVTEEGDSKMTVYNDMMTVQQLVDLTTFLQDTYTVYVPAYKMYYYP
jgi:hypothetical protein